MARRKGRTRAWQIVLLILLAICVAQLLWWILDEAHYTHQVATRTAELYRRSARAANALLAAGVSAERISALFPFLSRSPDGKTFELAAPVREQLWRDRFHRLNRYGWEGSFFLVVLLAGMSILARTLRQEAELQRRQQNFLAAVSHEFKSPLASLRLSAETLALRDLPGPRRQALVGRMLDDLGRLERMVLNLLDTTRIEEGRIGYRPERLPLQPLVQSVLAELDQLARASSVSLRNEVPAELSVWIDPLAARTVLQNLVDNAINATAAAGGGGVVLRAREGRGAVQLEVADSGIGFAPEEADRLFEKFYRTGDEMVRRSRGSGLGLYLVQRFVELGGGTVRAASAGPGSGAVFKVDWPSAP
jgi:signal transduction histidine kinase